MEKTVGHYAPDDFEVAYAMQQLRDAISGFIHVELQKTNNR